MTDMTTEARADLATALQEMSATKCKADHKTMGAKGKKTCPACGAKLGTSGVEEADVAELRESVLHALETFDPAKHARGRGGRFIDTLNKLAHDHRGTPDGRRFGAAKQNFERGVAGPSRVAPLRNLGPQASAQLIHMLTPLSLAHEPRTHADARAALLRRNPSRRYANGAKAGPGETPLRGELPPLVSPPDHGPKGGQSSALKPLAMTSGPKPTRAEREATARKAYPTGSKVTTTVNSVGGRSEEVSGEVVDHKFGSLRVKTPYHGTIVVPLGEARPMTPPKTSDAGRSGGKPSPGVASLDIAKPDTWNDRWNDQTMLRPGSNASRHVQDVADAILDGGKSGTGSAHIPGTGGASDTLAPEVLKAKNVNDLAEMVERDWGPKVNFGARPYLDAMRGMRSIDSTFGLDSGRTVVAYFLSNASQWRGPVAKAVKKELKRRLDAKS